MEQAWVDESDRLTKQRDYYHDEARHAKALVIAQAERIAALEAAIRLTFASGMPTNLETGTARCAWCSCVVGREAHYERCPWPTLHAVVIWRGGAE